MRKGTCKCVKGRKLCRLKNGRVKFTKGTCGSRKKTFPGGFVLSGNQCRDKAGGFVPVYPNCAPYPPKKTRKIA